jgi:STE24 endopeptidase
LIFDIYDTFVIEARFGFNKTTAKTYIADLFKGLGLTGIIGGGLLSLFIFLYERMGNHVFLVFFFILIGLSLFFAFISPFLIRIFNKLTPLDDGELKEKVEALVAKTGYKIKGIYMVDASRRSTKLNAFASGFGKTKTIGLYDTLIEKMTIDEILAILAHEIGHAKKHHVLKSAPFGFFVIGILLLAAYFIVTLPAVSQAFGFAKVNLAFGIYVMFILVSPLMLLLDIPGSIISRKHEYEADAFEKELVGRDAPISAMKKLYREDLGNLTPHPFVVMISHSHPTASQRIAAFEAD